MLKKIGIGFVVLIIVAAIVNQGEETSSSGSSSSVNKANYIGDTVSGSYFSVTVLGVTEQRSAPVEYMCEAAPSGSRYVMVNIAIENIDDESRQIMEEGELHINHDGKVLEYDQTESCVMGQDGYLNWLDDLGPFIRREGRVAFVVSDRFDVSQMSYQVPRGYDKIRLTERPAEPASSGS
tara:strand:- start:1506 stop:2045 length:540 start_codon:yes stop_codon:yes gene_type:complete